MAELGSAHDFESWVSCDGIPTLGLGVVRNCRQPCLAAEPAPHLTIFMARLCRPARSKGFIHALLLSK